MERVQSEDLKEILSGMLEFIHPTNSEILQILYVKGEQTYGSLCKMLRINKSSLEYQLQNLKKCGVVGIKEVPQWRKGRVVRICKVRITKLGEHILYGLFGNAHNGRSMGKDCFFLTFEVLRYIRKRDGKATLMDISKHFSITVRLIETLIKKWEHNKVVEMKEGKITFTKGGKVIAT